MSFGWPKSTCPYRKSNPDMLLIVLHRHDRLHVRHAVLVDIGPVRGDGADTPFGWRVTPNRVMLLLNERYFQADLTGGRRAFPIEGFA